MSVNLYSFPMVPWLPWYRGKYKSHVGLSVAPPKGCWHYHSSNPEVLLSSFHNFGRIVEITGEEKFENDKIYYNVVSYLSCPPPVS